jgi:glucosamine-6-phosphate deaminase
MECLIVNDYDELSQKAAGQVIRLVESSEKQLNICIPTGRTPSGMYTYLIQYSHAHPHAFDRVNWFTLDEYVPLPSGSPLSCYSRLREQFYLPAGISHDKTYTFQTDANDFLAEAHRYERLIERFGGLTLSILGIGRNGHVGFNEPGSELDSKARPIILQPKTIEQTQNYFKTGDPIPTQGITLGIQMLFSSQEILLFANGHEKADIVHEVVEGEIDPSVPASFFRNHPKAYMIIDQEAAAGLTIGG